MDGVQDDAKVMWRPDPSKRTKLDDFRDNNVNAKHNLQIESYSDLWQWSVDRYDAFWEECWRFFDIIHSEPYHQVIDMSAGIETIPEWFRGSKLNYAENMLRFDEDDRVAIYAAAEGKKDIDRVTFKELKEKVSQYAAAMKKMGIKCGDRVVGYIPNCEIAIEAMLAAASIGAVWSSTSPDFGVTGVLDRFKQIQPKLIFSVDAVVYNGKSHDHMAKLKQVVLGLPELEKVVLIPYVNDKKDVDVADIPNGTFVSDFLDSGKQPDGTIPPLTYEQLPFNHPLYIMYSSGTTGVPKCMVHSAGGTLIQHLKEHVLHGNMTRDDVIIYYTTTGWMMWNWLVTSLAVGAAVVLYDGSPLVPSANVLWDLVEKLGITILGTGAKWLQVLNDKQVYPNETHKLESLHTILSTGSPLTPSSFDYVYSRIKSNLLLGSITGGTDIVSCFMGQNWNLPVHRGEIQGRNLGMAVESWNDDGKPVYGESAELVCTKPFPCMPTHFWNDQDGVKYKKAYFSKYNGVWAHGDFCLINPKTNGILMQGRSDGTLNPSGVRFGSADIYNVVEDFKEIQDSLCVPQRNQYSEERVILFLKMVPDVEFSKEVIQRMRQAIRKELSARHVPELILETKDIPYTINGKKVEVAVRKVIAGEEVTHRGAFANPESLDLYKNIPELQGSWQKGKIQRLSSSPSVSSETQPIKKQKLSHASAGGDVTSS